jgi:hypothetical protein
MADAFSITADEHCIGRGEPSLDPQHPRGGLAGASELLRLPEARHVGKLAIDDLQFMRHTYLQNRGNELSHHEHKYDEQGTTWIRLERGPDNGHFSCQRSC